MLLICTSTCTAQQPRADNITTESLLSGDKLDALFFPFDLPANSANTISVVFNGYRRAMIEPCGCIDFKLGGIDKEARLTARLDELKIPTVHVDAGGFAKEVSNSGAMMQTRYQLLALQAMKLDAVNICFVELGYGVPFLRDAQSSYSLPFISCNVVDSTSATLFAPYNIVTRKVQGGHEIRFGIIGATRSRIRPSASPMPPSAGASCAILDPVDCIRKHLPDMRANCDITILLHYDTIDGMKAMLQQLGPDNRFDVAIAGESPGKLATPQHIAGTWLASGGFEGRQVGHMAMQFTGDTVTSVSAKMVDVLQTLPPVPKLTHVINEYQSKSGKHR